MSDGQSTVYSQQVTAIDPTDALGVRR